jgi:NADH/NAD ratio-sensing transcriptional regulator Rex
LRKNVEDDEISQSNISTVSKGGFKAGMNKKDMKVFMQKALSKTKEQPTMIVGASSMGEKVNHF